MATSYAKGQEVQVLDGFYPPRAFFYSYHPNLPGYCYISYQMKKYPENEALICLRLTSLEKIKPYVPYTG